MVSLLKIQDHTMQGVRVEDGVHPEWHFDDAFV